MLDEATRQAILKLREAGHGTRAIASAIGISRGAVRAVLRAGTSEVPRLVRAEKAEPYRDDVLALYATCKQNLVRVHEELAARGAALSYQALTAFCRRHGIGHELPKPAGHYEFAPGQEMQHDTSPHDVEIAGRLERAQTASLAFCFCRMRFVQLYPRFTRFICKVFMTEALKYFEGACGDCMIDNTHVVVLRGTGADMVPVPEMASFAERYGFTWKAHAVGNANRSAHVERGFDHVDGNFLAGRKFASWEDANRQAVIWCDKVNAQFRRHLSAAPRELFAAERRALKPLPIWVPEVYDLHHRIIDTEGYVNVHGSKYSVPWQLIGRQIEVRETKDRLDVYLGPRRVASHERPWGHLVERVRVTLREHRPVRGERSLKIPPEERALLEAAPQIAGYLGALKKREGGRGTLALRKLLRMVREYPRDAFCAALATATEYGLFDLERVERLVLRNVARDFFPSALSATGHDDDDPDDDEDPHE
jgi:transposase